MEFYHAVPERKAPSGLGPPSLFGSAEFRGTLAAVSILICCLAFFVGALGRYGSSMLLDFRTWDRVSSSSVDPVESYERIQGPYQAQRPFRATIQLEPQSVAGDWFAVERRLDTPQDRDYCFSVGVFFESRDGIRGGAPGALTAVVSINGARFASIPARVDEEAEIVEVKGIRPLNGEIALRLELRAEQGYQEAPEGDQVRVNYEFARLEPCRT